MGPTDQVVAESIQKFTRLRVCASNVEEGDEDAGKAHPKSAV